MLFPTCSVTMAERWGAAFAYFGVGSVFALKFGRSAFVIRHARTALSLHLLRILISGIALGLWHAYQLGPQFWPVEDFITFNWHLIGLLILGVPLAPFGGNALAVWLVPTMVIWFLDLLFFLIALQGRGLPWDEPPPVTVAIPSMHHEKERIRRLRDARLERISYSVTTAASERLRERRIEESKRELGAHLVRVDHLNHLLALGELSTERYHELRTEIQEEIDALREDLAALGARISTNLTYRPLSSNKVASLGGHLLARTLSLSVVDRSGTPLFTYGHFPLDEALVAGMLSAFDSISREVFGSPINKTSLAEGQVVYFFHGQWCVLMTLFDSEPSPAQVGRFQSYLKTFEEVNDAELQRNPVEPARLTPIAVDSDLPTSQATAQP